MRIYFILILISLGHNCLSQNETILDCPQKGFGFGIVLHYLNDSTLILFKAEDYISNSSLPEVTLNMLDSEIYSLYSDLLEASKSNQTVIPLKFFNGHRYFPNGFTLIKLFKERKVLVLARNSTGCKEIFYRFRKVKKYGVYRIYERNTKRIIFETGYIIIER